MSDIPCRWRKLDHPEGAVCTSPYETTIVNGDTLYKLLQPGKCERCPFPDHRTPGEPARITTHGPGTELKRLLRLHGINPDAGCQCSSRAAEMDHRGPDWCEQNIEVIVGWMKEEADRRGWKLFSAMYARWLVRRAIKAARQQSSTGES